MIKIKNYDRGIVGVIDKYPMFVATCSHITKELKLKSHKYTEDMVFENFESFEEFFPSLLQRKDGEE